ncbi:NAD(P)H-dependent FAD/FMN reductase (plasmid) [Hartmannibacter diazotrophicus]|uniref:NAD(P)H-dependent FAD/FMN reductase n=1 Tax=Hartmannibacter diazotrophicus TaxID=1482074 RepID=A0A2C9DEF7_9HYPH|nr:FMN reductase [Hartmannibacter diazotrophicus]SON58521.1 NAD(P)H-dependent FAD/FMN reductase [Hartmannibacter diazotrophicus]
MPEIVGIAGSLSSPSRTRAVVSAAVRSTAERTGLTGAVYDLRDIGPSLGAAVGIGDLAPDARDVVKRILNADALIVGTPVYKGSYTGLFKHLFDLIEPAALKDKPILLTATGGGDRHALVIEHQLRPLFGFFEAATIATGVYASSADFKDGELSSPELLARLETATRQLASAIRAQAAFWQQDLATDAA